MAGRESTAARAICDNPRMAASEALQRAIQDAQAGRLEAALSSVRMLAKRRPDDLEAIAVLGLLLMQAGQLDQAIHHLSRAVALAPHLPGPRNNLANALVNARRHKEAEQHWLKALEADPAYARAWMGLAIARTHLHDAAGALQAAERGLALQPDWPEMTRNRAEALAAADRAEDAARALEDAVARHPGHAGLRSNLLMARNYLERPAEEIAAAHRGYARCVTVPPAPPTADRDPDRPLRIGVLSGDLNGHAVGFFADAIFRHLPAGWHVTAFATSAPRPADPVEAGLRGMAGAWCEATAMDDAALDRAIRERRIDVLVELGGHTSGGRLGALDRKPAPVIVTAIGYPNTTGHPAVDVRIVDSVTDPAGADALCTERLARIDPCFLCYRPPDDAPEPAMPAADGPITFGSFNLLSKVSAGTLAAWRGALDACPGSTLLLKSRNFADPSARAGLLARAAQAGIAPERVEVVAFTPGIAEHLALYRRVHVALDAFPYNGTTTTCEALWMGVPVVTMAGDRHAARVGASLLRAAGLPELVTECPEAFAQAAARLAGDPAHLAALRSGLRDRLRASPLLDAPGWATRFHGALREAWRAAK
jgi:predicted O-linked N-acetylglucosamine transferase (SPINDLY family)